MEFMNPNYLWLILALPVFFAAWYKWGRRSHTLKNTQVSRIRVGTKLGTVLTFLIWTSKGALWVSLCMAIAGSFLPLSKTAIDAAGVIYMTIDTSSSTVMSGPVNEQEVKLAVNFDKRLDPAYVPAEGEEKLTPMVIDSQLGAARAFIEHSHGLRVGVTIFDDKLYYIYPATKDQHAAIAVLPQIQDYVRRVWAGPGTAGTNFDGPTSSKPDGALVGAQRVFGKEPGNPTRIYIMITDGISSIADDRAKELRAAYEALGIKFFVFGVGKEWTDVNADKVKTLVDFTRSVNGTIVSVQDKAQWDAALAQIDQLARASVRTVYVNDRQDSLLFLLAVAAVSFAMWIGLSAIRRSSP
jgi:hypothetical protein